jgi:hypothetical protein
MAGIETPSVLLGGKTLDQRGIKSYLCSFAFLGFWGRHHGITLKGVWGITENVFVTNETSVVSRVLKRTLNQVKENLKPERVYGFEYLVPSLKTLGERGSPKRIK